MAAVPIVGPSLHRANLSPPPKSPKRPARVGYCAACQEGVHSITDTASFLWRSHCIGGTHLGGTLRASGHPPRPAGGPQPAPPLCRRHGPERGASCPARGRVKGGGSAPSDSPLRWTLQVVMDASLLATLTAPTPASEVGSAESEMMEAVLTELMADEVVVLELQSILGSQANPGTVAGGPVAQQRVIFHGMQGALDSTASDTTPLDTPPRAARPRERECCPLAVCYLIKFGTQSIRIYTGNDLSTQPPYNC